MKSGGGTLVSSTPDVVIDASTSVDEGFAIAQAIASQPPRLWVCLEATSDDLSVTWASGARVGFAKALGQEWDACDARVVAAAPSRKKLDALILSELTAADGAVEVRWSGAKRSVMGLETAAFPETGASWGDESVVLLTGGARGITAEVARVVASRGPCTLVLVGRSPAGDLPLDEAGEKARIKEELAQEGGKVTPKRVNDRLAPLRKAEEIRKTIEALSALGAKVEYVTCDMASSDAVQALVNDVTDRFGAPTVCVHGAGIEESRMIADKDAKAFHRVFDGKAIGGLALANALPESCFLVYMGSVAGRFGNAGQVDYSAANEALAHVAMCRANTLQVDWTAWADVGMAVRGGMASLLTSRGVEMLPAEAGAGLLVDMVAAGQSGEFVVAGALGAFRMPTLHPMVDALDRQGDDVVIRGTLSTELAPWILDHSIDGVPVLPGVVGLEWMTAAAAAALPGSTPVGAENVEFLRPVKLHRNGSVELEATAEPVDKDRVRCTLRSRRVLKTGREQVADHFVCEVVFASLDPSNLTTSLLPNDEMGPDLIYSRFFHGPIFQVLQKTHAIAREGIMATGAVRHRDIASALLTAPLVTEAAFQAAGLHQMALDGVMALPASIEQVVWGRPVIDDEEISLNVCRRADGAYDVDALAGEDVLLSLRGYKMVVLDPLPPDRRLPEPEGGWPSAVVGEASVETDATGVLDQSEIAELRARGMGLRPAERIAGRVAAKRAVSALTGASPEDIRISNLESGEPVAEVLGHVGPMISISHRAGQAVAVACMDARVGIDRELIEPRDKSFADTWFSPEEQEVLGRSPEGLTVGWAAKEAVLKVLGTGMAVDPRNVQIVGWVGCAIEVRLIGDASQRLLSLGGGTVSVNVRIQGVEVVAGALLAA